MTVLPMNPQSVLFPEAPAEDVRRVEPTPAPPSFREAIRRRYLSGVLTHDQALEALHRSGYSWDEANRYLLVD